MKILMTAYSCMPEAGREPGFGWNTPWQIAQLGHEVWGMTIPQNLAKIEPYLASHQSQPNLHFIPVPYPAWIARPDNAGIKIPVINPAETVSFLAQAVGYMYKNPDNRL